MQFETTEGLSATSAPGSGWRRWLADFVTRWMAVAVVLVAAGAAAGWCSPYVIDADPPESYWRLALFLLRVFSFHMGVGMLVAVVAAVALRRWRLGLAALALGVLLTASSARDFLPKPAPAIAGPPLRVACANLFGSNRDPGPLIAALAADDADLVALVEYRRRHHELAQAALGAAYPHQFVQIRPDNFGIALYSRVPFVEPPRLVPVGTDPTPQIRAAVEWHGRPLAVYVLHVAPPGGPDNLCELDRGFADLRTLFAAEPLPLLACGDFNVPPESPHYAVLAALGLRSTHELAGFGRGATWPNRGLIRHLPGVRIDHIFVSPELAATTHEIGAGFGSDHLAVHATVGWRTGRP